MKNLTTFTVDSGGNEESYPFDVDNIDYFAFLERGIEDSEVTVGVGGRIFLYQGKAARSVHSLLSSSMR